MNPLKMYSEFHRFFITCKHFQITDYIYCFQIIILKNLQFFITDSQSMNRYRYYLQIPD